ncbi:MAG: RHS repeat-associated core domain-containing protein [Bacteroidia bacterium]|nr:RHS repeat-associated core domain-containing protein [Bacteroidia bacterium]
MKKGHKKSGGFLQAVYCKATSKRTATCSEQSRTKTKQAEQDYNLMENATDIQNFCCNATYQNLLAHIETLPGTQVQALVLDELHLYGSNRLGILKTNFNLIELDKGNNIIFEAEMSAEYTYRDLGSKRFELSNHLGNVLATVLDRKTGVFDPTEDTLMYYEADVVNAKLYYPFGKAMMSYRNPEFSFAYSFNGMERDNETDLTNFGARFYSEDYGRWLSPDPLWHIYPSITPYRGFLNNPIFYVDEKGNTEIRTYSKDGKFTSVFIPDGSLAVYKVVNKPFFGPAKYNRTLEYIGSSLNFADNGVDVSQEAYTQYASVARLKTFTYEEWRQDKLTNACKINFQTLIENQTDYAMANWRQDASKNTFCNYTFFNTLFTITGIDAQSWNSVNGKFGYTANNLVKNIDKLKWTFNVNEEVQEITLFKEVTWEEAVQHAQSGGLAVAVQSGTNHGHVTILSSDQEGVDDRDKVKTRNVGVEESTGTEENPLTPLNEVWTNPETRKGVKFYIMDTRAQSQDGTTSTD